MADKSPDLVDFLVGPMATSQNQMVHMMEEWQGSLVERLKVGQTPSREELQWWFRAAAAVMDFMARLTYESTGVDIRAIIPAPEWPPDA